VAVVKVKNETELDTRFLYYFMEAFKDDLLVPLMKGAANVSLTLDSLSSVRVPIPGLAEQKRLMQTLLGLDGEIAAAQLRVEGLAKSRVAAVPAFKAAFGEIPPK
jgi:Type I restriction modification DNA specificity domain